ncbi:MAG: hypothetical protein LUC41_01135 [Clostridiales bacterium]|nr:hypothetical protein [Clostridiales bacterium]
MIYRETDMSSTAGSRQFNAQPVCSERDSNFPKIVSPVKITANIRMITVLEDQTFR